MAKNQETPQDAENKPVPDEGGAGDGLVKPEPSAVAHGQVSEGGQLPNPNADDDGGEEGEHGDDGVHDPEAPFGRRADGTPAKKRGPKPKQGAGVSDEKAKQRARLKSVTQGKPRPQQEKAIDIEPLAMVNYQAMGEAVASMWFHGGAMLLGPEWEPDMQAGEHLAVAGAFRDYFKANQYKDLPPGFQLVFVLGIYSLKRATKPTIKTKLQRFGLWVKTSVGRFRK